MKILMVGDVVGKAGRRAVSAVLPHLRTHYEIDFVVVNAENAAAGFGITEAIARELFEQDIDVLTSGNHIWDKREALEFIEREPRLLRPHNYPDDVPGTGWITLDSAGGHRVGVLNIMGTVFMHPGLDCPFRCADKVLAAKAKDLDVILVDFHAETTSEKQAMGWYLDGRVGAVVGTHTHVMTADEQVLPAGTAYISDLGMTGCHDSVIGMNKEKVLRRFVNKLPERFEVANGAAVLCGVVIDFDLESGKSTSVERIKIHEDQVS